MWPDDGRRRLLISPWTHTAGTRSSSAVLILWVSSDTVRTVRSLIGGGRPSGASAASPRELASGREQRVPHEHGDGHGTDAARHGCDGADSRAHRGEVHVAGEPAGIEPVHADVDDD